MEEFMGRAFSISCGDGSADARSSSIDWFKSMSIPSPHFLLHLDNIWRHNPLNSEIDNEQNQDWSLYEEWALILGINKLYFI